MIQCRFENGHKASLRHVTVSSIVLNKEHKQVLLAKRSLNVPNPGLWCLPGGYVDRDETTSEAAIRETFEETGYRVKPLMLLRLIDSPKRPKEDRQNIEFAYVLESLGQEKDKDRETAEIHWFDFDEVPPSEFWAYDHRETFDYYVSWLKKKFKLPLFRDGLI